MGEEEEAVVWWAVPLEGAIVLLRWYNRSSGNGEVDLFTVVEKMCLSFTKL